MKRGTPRHPKVLELSLALELPKYAVVGLLEMLWHFAAEFALDGGIGKFSDAMICEALCWDGDSTMLVQALVSTKFVDQCKCHRLRIHDWPSHADQTVQRVLINRNQEFAPCYDDASTMLEPSYPPLPSPSPKPIPIPSPIIDEASSPTIKAITKRGRKSKSGPVWDAYALAYEQRYDAPPVRNARSNALCCQLVDRLGADEAPPVAAYYLQSCNGFYIQRGHALSTLVADAEKLRTEWATGRQVTQAKAREVDRLKKMGDGWQETIDKFSDDSKQLEANQPKQLKG